MKQPKFKVGDKVRMTSKNLYGETEGKVIEFQKIFHELDRDGEFKVGGLTTLESNINSIRLPHTFDGETLSVEMPQTDLGEIIIKARTLISKFKGYAYTVKTPKMNTIISEGSIRAL
jgi:hypothetical protein